MSDNDGVDDALRSAAQVTAGLVARAAEIQARQAEQHQRSRQYLIEQATTQTTETTGRAMAEHQAALARLNLVNQPHWWDTASVDDVAHAWELAHAFQDHPDATTARETISKETATRWNVTINGDVEPAALHTALRRAEAARAQADHEQIRADELDTMGRAKHSESLDQDDLADAAILQAEDELDTGHAAEADQDEEVADAAQRSSIALELDSAHDYDSAEQREVRARQYDQCGDAKAAEARKLSDSAQATPPTHAIRASTKRKTAVHRPRQPALRQRIKGDRSR